MSSYDPNRYEERQAANDRSRRWATRDGMPWTPEEDARLLKMWGPYGDGTHRDETEVSKSLRRTIEACRNRVHHLRGVHTGAKYMVSGRPLEQPALCESCWMVLPKTGVCDNCS